MEIKLCFLVTLLLSACPGLSGQDTCPQNSCTCNCGASGDWGDFYALQERVVCLESSLDQSPLHTGPVIPDCSNITSNGAAYGVYQLSPRDSEPFEAFCVFDDLGKWTVIQHRANGDTSFDRAWVEYKQGFGRLEATANFWLGLEKMHVITRQRQYTLRVELTNWDDTVLHAEYSLFSISDEEHKYAIRLMGYSGTLPDALTAISQGTPFTTMDQDNDSWVNNCAVEYNTGWWHTACYSAQLNGPYRIPPDNAQNNPRGITWHPLNGSWVSMKASRMRIKPTFDD